MNKHLFKFIFVSTILIFSVKNSYATLTATINTTDVNTGALFQSEIANVLFGMNVTSTTTTTFTSFTLSSSQTINSYFSNFKLYVSTTGSYVNATKVTGATFSTLAATSLTVTLPAASNLTANSTYYYYVVADFTGSGTLPVTFQFTETAVVSAAASYTGANIPYNNYQLNSFKTYYWTGNAGGNSWRTLNNWSFSNQISGAAATSYPGQSAATDVITTAVTVSAASITLSTVLPNNLAQIYIPAGVSVTISTTPVLTTTILYLDEDAANDQALLTVSGSGSLAITGTTTLMANAEVLVKGAVTFGPSVNFSDVNALVYNSGGTINASSSTFAMTATGAYINNAAGSTFNATSSIFTLSGKNAEIYNAAAFTSSTSGTFTLSGQKAQIYNAGTGAFTTNTAATFILSGDTTQIYNAAGGTFTTNTNASYTLSGNSSLVQNANGTFNANNAGSFNLSGTNSLVNNSNGTFNAYATSFSLTGDNAELLVSGGNFYAYAGGAYTLNTPTASKNAIILVNSNGFYTATSCTFSLNGNKNLFNTNVRGSTIINTSTITLAGTSTYFNNSGILNLLGCTVNVTGAYSSGYFGFANHKNGTFGIGSTLATDATTINLGTSVAATTVGPSSVVYCDGGIVNLGAASIINCFAPNTTINNTNTTTPTTGTITCYPTSIINLYSATSIINNDNPNAYFTLLSDATGSATIGQLTAGASITGVYNVQRYLTGGNNTYRNYRLVSSPVNMLQAASSNGNNNIDLSYLGASATLPANSYGAFISGPGSGFGATPLHQTTNPIIYLYQESITPGTTYNKSFTSGKNVGINAINTSSPYNVTTVSTATNGVSASGVSVPAGNAYLLYYIGSNQRTGTTNTVFPDASTVTASGYINQGTVKVFMWGVTPTKNLTYTTGANSRNPGLTMIGNPYPSTIDLHQFYLDNSSALNGTFYELSDVTQQFPTYNGASNLVSSSPAGGSQYVASGQGFYMVLSAAGSVSFKEDQKTPSTTSAVFPSPSLLSITPPATAAKIVNSINAPKITDEIITTAVNQKPSGVHLKLIKDSVNYDECAIFFSGAWTDNFDKYDSFDLDGLGPKVYLSSYTSDNVRTSINALGDYIRGKRVKLNVKTTTDGTYKLQLEDIQNINTNKYNVYLIDHKLADSVDLVKNLSYTATITVSDTASFSGRFELVVRHKPVPLYKLLSFSGQKISVGVKLIWKTMNEGDYTGFTLQKKVGNSYVTIDSLQSDSAANYNVVDPHPTLGNNIYRLGQNDINGNITYSAPVTIGYNSTSPSSGLAIYPNPAKSIINVTYGSGLSTLPNFTANIYNTSGTLIGTKTVTSTSWTEDVSSYKLGVYILELKDSSGLLLGESKFVKIN